MQCEKGQSLKDFVLEFMRLQGESGITDPKALIPAFTSKLPASVRVVLNRSNPPPITLEDWYSRVLQDNEVYEQEQILRHNMRTNEGPTKDKAKKAISTRATTIPKRRKLTEEELELKRQGLCFVCKQAGHMARQCPNRPKKSVNVRAVEEDSAEEADEEDNVPSVDVLAAELEDQDFA